MSLPAADFIFRTAVSGRTGVLSLLTTPGSLFGLRLRDPAADCVKGLLEVDAVDADAQNLY